VVGDRAMRYLYSDIGICQLLIVGASLFQCCLVLRSLSQIAKQSAACKLPADLFVVLKLE
jgi:hypothetical protein